MLDEGEDEKTVAGHIEIMKRELKKAGGSMEKVGESMGKTFKSRRAFIDSKPSLQNLLEVYPALKKESQVKLYSGVRTVVSLVVHVLLALA